MTNYFSIIFYRTKDRNLNKKPVFKYTDRMNVSEPLRPNGEGFQPCAPKPLAFQNLIFTSSHHVRMCGCFFSCGVPEAC